MKRWIELTDEYTKTLKDGCIRKVRIQNASRQELVCFWIESEKCFYHDPSDSGFYMDEPENRPTHILIG